MSQTVSHCIKINLSFQLDSKRHRKQKNNNITSQIGSKLANRLHERKRLTIKIGYPLCTHAPVGTKCRGKKSFPFVHLPILGIEGRETSSNQGGLSTRLSFSLLTMHDLEKTQSRVKSIFSKVHFGDSAYEIGSGTIYTNVWIESCDYSLWYLTVFYVKVL